MKVLLIGSGGREHAIAYRLAQSPKCDQLFIAPGNPGTYQCGQNVSISADNVSELVNFAKNNPRIIDNNFDALVSTDFIRSEYASTIDHRFLNVKDNYIKLICWYDNEWGYSSKVVDLIAYIVSK